VKELHQRISSYKVVTYTSVQVNFTGRMFADDRRALNLKNNDLLVNALKRFENLNFIWRLLYYNSLFLGRQYKIFQFSISHKLYEIKFFKYFFNINIF